MSALAESLIAELRIDIPRPLKRSRLVGALVSPQSKLLSLLWLGTSLRYTNHLQAFQASCRSDGGRGFGHKIAAKYVDFTSTPENSSRSRSYACSTATSSLWSGKALVVCECLVWILTGSDLKSVTALWVGRTARNGSASKLHLSSSDEHKGAVVNPGVQRQYIFVPRRRHVPQQGASKLSKYSMKERAHQIAHQIAHQEEPPSSVQFTRTKSVYCRNDILTKTSFF